MKIPINLIFKEIEKKFLNSFEFFQPKKETTTPIKEIATPTYIKACGGEKKVSGLLSKWFVMSQLPPTVTSRMPKLERILPIAKMFFERVNEF